MTEDEVVGWHHRLKGHEFEQLWDLVMDRLDLLAVQGTLKSLLQHTVQKQQR